MLCKPSLMNAHTATYASVARDAASSNHLAASLSGLGSPIWPIATRRDQT
jgi:hypothetical protein